MKNMRSTEQFYRYLLKEGKAKATAETYASTVRLFEKEGYKYDFDSICRWKEDLCQRCKPASVNLRIHSMNEFLEYNSVKFKLKQIRVQAQHFVEAELTNAQYVRLLNGLKKDGNYQYWTAVKIMAGTGVRISEFLQITLADVRQGYVDVCGKGTKYRRVWFPSKMRNEILSVYSTEGLILPYTARYIRFKLKGFAKKYNIPEEVMHPHEFRSFYARNVYAKTKDVRLLQDLLGHENISTTMKYLRKTSASIGKRISSIVDW